jgi:creatinine amidohydrolase
MRTRQIALLRPDEVRAEIERFPVVYWPLGPVEWHGPHLPLGTDPLNADNAARLAAELTGGLVLPTFYWGTERERSPQMLDWLGLPAGAWVVGMDFPHNSLPSLYASEEIFALLVREQLRLVSGWGFRLIVIISGHGADNHLAVLERLAAEFNAAESTRVMVLMAFATNDAGLMPVGHGSKVETEIMLALQPESVSLEGLPQQPEPLNNVDWAIVDYETFAGQPTPDRAVHAGDDPRLANPAAGQEAVQRTAAQIAEKVKAVWNELQGRPPKTSKP